MKKTKIKRRIENAFDAFFADENSGENKLATYRNEANLRHERKFEETTQSKICLETVLRQSLLFFPGTFVLYLLSMTFTVMFVSIFTNTLRRGMRGTEFIFFGCILLVASLMTWLGLGDVRKPKHFVIPASIISVGIFFGATIGILEFVSKSFTRFAIDNGIPFYIFPLALIVPFLAKGWVDRDS